MKILILPTPTFQCVKTIQTHLIEKLAREFGVDVYSKENENWIVEQLAILCHHNVCVTCISLLLKLFEVWQDGAMW